MTEFKLALRRVVAADCEMLFQWANDPVVRRSSFVELAVAWERHCEWFQTRLADPACLHYVVTTEGGEPIGQARFEVSGSREAVIAISIADGWRGRGLGTEAIRLTTAQVREDAGVELVRAFIRPENRPSVRAFTKAGYSAPRRVRYNGRPALCMTWS